MLADSLLAPKKEQVDAVTAEYSTVKGNHIAMQTTLVTAPSPPPDTHQRSSQFFRVVVRLGADTWTRLRTPVHDRPKGLPRKSKLT